MWSSRKSCLQVTQGHAPPVDARYKLKASMFFIDPDDASTLTAVPHEPTYASVDAVDPGFALSDAYNFVWNEDGSGASRDCSAWRPRLADGAVYFGDIIHASDDKPTFGTLISTADHVSLFAAPDSWELVCRKKKGDHKLYGWRAVPPSPLFVALGDVVTQSSKPPAELSYRCIHKALLREAELGPQLWNDEGGLFNRGEKVAMWEAPTISGHPTTMALANSFDEPPATQVYWQLRPRFTPVEVRPLAMASRDVVPEPDAEADLLSLKQFEYVVVLDDDAQAGWWTVYSVRRPDRVGLVPKNYLKKIPTQLCVALYAWPQAGQPAAQGDLSFRPGDLVVATETNGNWWHGFRRDAPEANGKFPANYVECR